MFPDITDVVKSAEGSIDRDILEKQGSGGFISTGYLHDKPLVDYLKESESLEYLFDNKKKGITATRDGEEQTINPGSDYRAILAVTSQRILCVVGGANGDEVIEIPLQETSWITVDNRSGNGILKVETRWGTIEFNTYSGSEISSAAGYIERRQADLKNDESTETECGTAEKQESTSSASESESPEKPVSQNSSQPKAGAQVVQANSEKPTVEEAEGEEGDTGSLEESYETPEYFEPTTVPDSTLSVIQDAEEKAGLVTTEIEDLDEPKQLLTRAHNTLCQVLVKDEAGIDQDRLEERIGEIEEKIDSLDTPARHLESARTDESGDDTGQNGDAPKQEELLDELRRIADERGCVPTSKHVEEYGQYSVAHYPKEFGSVRKAVGKAGMDAESGLTDAIKAIAVGLGQKPESKEFDKYTSYSSGYVRTFFDDWQAACEAAGVGSGKAVNELLSVLSPDEAEYIIKEAPVTDELYEEYEERMESNGGGSSERDEGDVILNTIEAIAIGIDKRPKSSKFHKFSDLSIHDVYNNFESWTAACKTAGVNSNSDVEELGETLSKADIDELLENAALSDKFYEMYPDINSQSRGKGNQTEKPDEKSMRERLIEDLEAAIADLGRLPTYSESFDYDGIKPQECSQEFGSWEKALQATDTDVESRLLDALQDVGSELGRAPTKSEMDEHGLYDSNWYSDNFDSWKVAIEKAGLHYPSSSDLSDELERLKAELGHVPARRHVEEHGDYPPRFYQREYDSVKKATAAAGMDYREDVIDQIRQLAIELERRPKAKEFGKHAVYSISYVYDLFDTWGDACRAADVDSDAKVKELIEESEQTKKEKLPSREIDSSPLAEYYEVFGNLVAMQEALLGENMGDYLDGSAPMARWHELVQGQWAGKRSGASADSYATQQNERTDFTIAEYREEYGDGDAVDDFQAIETASLSEGTAELVSYLSGFERSEALDIQIPKAPGSGEVLPVFVETTTEFERAEALIDEFPDKPNVKIDGQDGGDGGSDTGIPGPDDEGAVEPGSEPDTEDELTEIGGVTESVAKSLRSAGYYTKEDLKEADSEELSDIDGVGSQTASRIKLLIGS